MERKKSKIKLIVKDRFRNKFREILLFLRDEASKKYTDEFSDDMEGTIRKIYENPRHHAVEPQLKTKRELYRYYMYKKKWKIIFKTLDKLLVILGIVHVKQDPKNIKKLRTTDYRKDS